MPRSSATALALFCLGLTAAAQDASPAFDVAAIKPNRSGVAGGDSYSSPSPGRLQISNSTLRYMIQMAYHMRPGTLFGATGWMESDRFDIEAKAPAAATFDQELTMLQALLADRFQLRFHHETRDLKSLALVLAKSGPRLHLSADQSTKEQVSIRATSISGTAIPFGHFVSILGAQMHESLANETGLTSKYDLDFHYVPDTAEAASGQSLYAALDQLGLKLETRRGPVDVMVIDSARKPEEN